MIRQDLFLSNTSEIKFIDKIKTNLEKCKSFNFSVSFIKKAGLDLIQHDIEQALLKGCKGIIITSTYQNFTDVSSLNIFLNWQNKFPNFKCHLEFDNFKSSGFHTKGYLFEFDDYKEIIIGSSNITKFALLNNKEWDLCINSENDFNSYINAKKEFDEFVSMTQKLNQDLIDKYYKKLKYSIYAWDMDIIDQEKYNIKPNLMQQEALTNLSNLRRLGEKNALVVSATGSGKTYLAAFDARNFNPRKMLFLVHRETILNDAKNTFIKVFQNTKTMGLYTGNKNEKNCEFIFATTSMLSKHLEEFDKNEFDYICYDEAHHIVANTGKKIIEYFNPEFMLGLTATPERMDEKDVFDVFENNVAYELRLKDAIENDLIVPFKYYGIKDELISYKDIKNKTLISNSIAESKNIDFICKEIEKHKKSNEKLKAIAFCVDLQHCALMQQKFISKGYNAIDLTGSSLIQDRMMAFKNLEDDNNELEIICAVDILNEGVDIPSINMVLFLRPTESEIIFLQQLGRGLRKYKNKKDLIVLDFIANDYDRSVQIAKALGTLSNTTILEKAHLKQLIKTDFKSLNIKGLEIHIDELSKKDILKYLEKTNFNTHKQLKSDYDNFKKYINKNNNFLTHKDFLDNSCSPDILRYINTTINGKKNYCLYNYLKFIEENNIPNFNENEIKTISIIEKMLPIVRKEEYLLLKQLLNENRIDFSLLIKENSNINDTSLAYALKYLSTTTLEKDTFTVLTDNTFTIGNTTNIKTYLNEVLEYGLDRFEQEFNDCKNEFQLYKNYTKEQTMIVTNNNYQMNVKLKGTNVLEDGTTFIYVGLKKDKSKQERTNYKDKFLSPTIFQWESEKNLSLENKNKLLNSKNIHIFVRKIDKEDGMSLPFTYFGKGSFTNIKESYVYDEKTNKKCPTILTSIILENKVPEKYHFDFEIGE